MRVREVVACGGWFIVGVTAGISIAARFDSDTVEPAFLIAPLGVLLALGGMGLFASIRGRFHALRLAGCLMAGLLISFFAWLEISEDASLTGQSLIVWLLFGGFAMVAAAFAFGAGLILGDFITWIRSLATRRKSPPRP